MNYYRCENPDCGFLAEAPSAGTPMSSLWTKRS